MTRLDHDCAFATARAVVELVAHRLGPEERTEFFGRVFTAVETCLITRDERLKRERERLGRAASHE